LSSPLNMPTSLDNELDRRLSIRRGQIGRESEIASGGGVCPPAMVASGAFRAIVHPRELR
jgi:hypothetical protein